MPKWQYLIRIYYADSTDQRAKEYLQKTYPNWKPEKYTATSLEPILNIQGAEGWELIHLTPVDIGGTLVAGKINHAGSYSAAYLAVFKRMKE